MSIMDKLEALSDSAKYDVACTSSGADGGSFASGGIGNKTPMGICHSFAADGRCISLLKVLMTNICINDCKYCVNRKSNMEIKRTVFTPRELADLTIGFYKRNYIEGLFLSSGIIKNADYTCELMIETLTILRIEYKFNGYIHAKAIPGADPILIQKIGYLADRISINIEMPSQKSLIMLAPEKSKDIILKPMGYIAQKISENSAAFLPAYQNHQSTYDMKTTTIQKRSSKIEKFAPAGQSTQMIIGASPENDNQILKLTQSLYRKYKLKRVFFSAYIPVSNDRNLPSIGTPPPLLREHRLYQADWLMRFYKFDAEEILDEKTPNFNPFIDPKCNWAIHHPEFFPIEINKASYANILRVPGIGVKSALKIINARKWHSLDFYNLKKLGVVMKRAQYFITCNGRKTQGLQFGKENIMQSLMSKKEINLYRDFFMPKQLEMFDSAALSGMFND
ncbi:MAG: putative DNA modification/repair radical SAM protein [Elusimicrobiota bacterium]|nr:putative DNA modification/repair radical SAM protein [Elusimicrobiota bacterium]